MELVKQIVMKVAAALLTEKMIKRLVILLLKKLAERSDNTVDDEIVAEIEKALEPKPEQ